MELRRKNRTSSTVEAGALNDIMFFLMLFFLIASTMVSPNVIKLLLPSSKTGKAVSKTQISVSVNKDLQYFINNEPVTLDQLESRLSEVTRNVSEPTVVLRVDKSVQVQSLVDILEIGNRLKVKMILATQSKK